MTKNIHNEAPNHYEVLGFASNLRNQISRNVVKAAYHKALLQHHPDKGSLQHRDDSATRLSSSYRPRYSVDEISLARKVLSDPIARAKYDRQLRLANDGDLARNKEPTGHVGVEVVDLEELDFDMNTSTWYRSCRCGNAKGYRVSEQQLEREASEEEIYVGCEGCSLWIRVLFEVEEPLNG